LTIGLRDNQVIFKKFRENSVFTREKSSITTQKVTLARY